jgi:hypothetical protein
MGPEHMGVEAVPNGCRFQVSYMLLAAQVPPRTTSPMTLNLLEGISSLTEWMVMQVGSVNLC